MVGGQINPTALFSAGTRGPNFTLPQVSPKDLQVKNEVFLWLFPLNWQLEKRKLIPAVPGWLEPIGAGDNLGVVLAALSFQLLSLLGPGQK